MDYLEEKIALHKRMVDSIDRKAIEKASKTIVDCYRNGKKVIIFGNGGSAADAMHFAAELEGQLSSLDKGRKALSALTPFNLSALTAISNDYNYDESFVRFVRANAARGDVVIGISTSGNSRNVLSAVKAARDIGATTVGLTGNGGGQLAGLVDVLMNIQAPNVCIIQEGHVIAYHRICALVVKELFGYDAMR